MGAYIEHTMISDTLGAAMQIALGQTEIEVTNNASRRKFDFSQGVGLARSQFALKELGTGIGVRIDYSLDDGDTWKVLVPTWYSNGVSNKHNISDTAQIPTEVIYTGLVMVRAVIVGAALAIGTFMYINLSLIDP